MFSNFLVLKLEYAMSVYQKFRDSKTAGPFFTPLYDFRTRVGLTRSYCVAKLLFTLVTGSGGDVFVVRTSKPVENI